MGAMGADERLSRLVPRRSSGLFEKLSLPGAPLRNRTVDLLLTISTASCTVRASCTDSTGYCTDGTCRAGIIRRAVPRPVPREFLWQQPYVVTGTPGRS